jgi:hypothetical protein
MLDVYACAQADESLTDRKALRVKAANAPKWAKMQSGKHMGIWGGNGRWGTKASDEM